MLPLIPLTLLLCQLPAQAGSPQPEPTPAAACCEGKEGEPVRRGIALRHMLNEPHVAADLQLDAAQKDAIRRLTEEYAVQAQGIHVRVFSTDSASREEREELAQEASQQQRQLRAAFEARFAELLTEPQRKRLQQIDIQLAGIDGLLVRDVAAELGLSFEQLKALVALQQETHTQALGLHKQRQEENLPREELERALAALRAQKNQRAEALLTADQLQRFADLQGRPIGFAVADLTLKLRVPMKVARADRPSVPEPEPTLAVPAADVAAESTR
jgi:hypothetical protein